MSRLLRPSLASKLILPVMNLDPLASANISDSPLSVASVASCASAFVRLRNNDIDVADDNDGINDNDDGDIFVPTVISFCCSVANDNDVIDGDGACVFKASSCSRRVVIDADDRDGRDSDAENKTDIDDPDRASCS